MAKNLSEGIPPSGRSAISEARQKIGDLKLKLITPGILASREKTLQIAKAIGRLIADAVRDQPESVRAEILKSIHITRDCPTCDFQPACTAHPEIVPGTIFDAYMENK